MVHARVLVAVFALAAATSVVSLLGPSSAFACSCVPPSSIAEYRGDPDYAVDRKSVV